MSLVPYQNGKYEFCKFSDEAVRDLIKTTEDGFNKVVVALEKQEEKLINKIVDKEVVHISIFKVVVYSLILIDVLTVIWFTGIAPIFKGIGFKEIREIITESK